MQLRYRLLHSPAGPGHCDVAVELPEPHRTAPTATVTTVGDLAAALHDHLVRTGACAGGACCDRRADRPAPTLTLVPSGAPDPTGPVDPAASVCDAAPPSGASVAVVALPGPTGPGSSPVASVLPSPSPVVWCGPGGDATVAWGATPIGPGGDPVGSLDASVVAVLEVGDAVVLRSTGAAPVRLDGAVVRGTCDVRDGAVVELAGATAVVHVDGPLRPPERGPVRAVRTIPAEVVEPVPACVELPPPPAPARTPGFPVLSAAVPLLMGAALWAVTRSWAVVGFVVFSFVFVVAAAVESRREHRAAERFRVAEFRRDLAAAAAELEELRDRQRAETERAAPDAATAAAWARDGGARRFERRPGAPGALTVRLGTGDVPVRDEVRAAAGGRTGLRAELDAVVAAHRTVRAPVPVDLDQAGCLAISGPADEVRALARALVVQLGCTVAPTGLGVAVWSPPSIRAQEWGWVDWLPHAAGSGQPARLVVVDALDGTPPGPPPTAPPGARWLWLQRHPGGLPDGTGAHVHLLDDDRGADDGTGGPTRSARLRRGDAPGQLLQPDGCSGPEAELVARALSPLVAAPVAELAAADRTAAPVAPHRSRAAAPAVTLADVIDPRRLVDPDALVAGWSASEEDLRAPIGLAGGVVDVDLRRDGPHALVAGTTGAGKSELLRTLVASLAAHHGPDRCTFLLIDYKGGAAFGPLVDLPHTVGLVTDLTPDLAERALVSLRAEVRHREERLAAAGAADAAELARRRPGALPALVVVVDEFATLAAEVPGFVDGLVDLAQRGRSLGIHLVLATQRPAGVVTDAIRANTSLRIALRTADPEDSRDVVDDPGAADLPADRPGAALVRFGPARALPVAVAHSGAPLPAATGIVIGPLGGVPGRPRRTPEGPSQLERLVGTAAAAARGAGIAPPRPPWHPPLPDRVDPDALPAAPDGVGGFGLVDLPTCQSRATLTLTEQPLLVLGAAGSGVSATLAAAAAAFLRTAPGPTVVVAVAGAGTAGTAAALTAHGIDAAGVVAGTDAERTLRALRALARRLDPGARATARATAGTAEGPALLVVDDLGALDELHHRVNRGEAMELLVRLAERGPRCGVQVLVGARRRAEVPPALLAAAGHRLALRCADSDEAVLLGISEHLAATTVPPGRGVVLAGPHAGATVAVVGAPGRPTALGATTPVPALPESVDERATAEACHRPGRDPWVLPVGIAAAPWEPEADLPTAALDLRHGPALVAGPPRSGVSTALASLAAAARTTGARTVLITSGRGAAASASAFDRVVVAGDVDARDVDARDVDAGADALAACCDELLQPPGHHEPVATLVCVDDADDLLDGPDRDTVESLLDAALRAGRRGAVRLVVGGDADALTRCWSDALRRLRSARTGLLLRPDPDLHPGLLHGALPPADELSGAAGRGWLVHPDGVVALQVTGPPTDLDQPT